jgi:hypothetical protein
MVGKLVRLLSASTLFSGACREYLLRTEVVRCKFPYRALPTAASWIAEPGTVMRFLPYAACNLSRSSNTVAVSEWT